MVALQGRRKKITVDKVLRVRGKMMTNRSNGPADCSVIEMLQCLPMETVYWFDKRSKGECRAPEAWDNSPPGISQEARRQVRQRATWIPCGRASGCSLSGTRRCWWTCCTRRRTRDTGSGRRTEGPIWNQGSTDKGRPSWQAWM